jgi:hypothetical protein
MSEGEIHPRDAAEVFDLRRAYWRNGYRPVPIYNRQKRPRGTNWRADAVHNPPLWAGQAPEDEALSTGIATGEVVAIDIDVSHQTLVDQLVHMVETLLGVTPLVRLGRVPKTLMVYRCAVPFTKLSTDDFVLCGGKAHVEILADGQQFVADGIHPDTGQPYTWTSGSPTDMPLAALPLVTEDEARAVIRAAEELLRLAGALPKGPLRARGGSKATRRGGSDFFANVNDAALGALGSWVPVLSPYAKYQPGTGAWRVSSGDLDRDLEEDLSLHPDGIRDFGLEEPRTAIDVVIEQGGAADATAAAFWLCDQLRVSPGELGWKLCNGSDEPDGRLGTGDPSPDGGGSPPPPPLPPPDEPDGIPDEYSDEALALRFSARHARNLRYLALFAHWYWWRGNHWGVEHTLKVFDFARAVCRAASAEVTTSEKLARDVASAKTVAAIERLARADRRHAALESDWDPDLTTFNTPDKETPKCH